MTTPNDVLRQLFRYHVWATEGLIAHLATLPPERLDAEVPGTYGSMLATLSHMIQSDSRYLRRFDDPELPPEDDWEPLPLETLRHRIVEQGRRWEDKLDVLERGELRASIRNHAGGYPDTDDAEGMLVLQALHHGNDHRTQINSTLGALGEEVPELDGWDYWAHGRS
jgi:uncharacterized damage-inducible protein DinB